MSELKQRLDELEEEENSGYGANHTKLIEACRVLAEGLERYSNAAFDIRGETYKVGSLADTYITKANAILKGE